MKAYLVDYKYNNNVDLLDTILYLFAKVVLNTEIAKRERQVIKEYMVNGYNKASNRAIVMDLGINKKNLAVINSRLQEKGFLTKDPNNRNNRHLSPELIKIKSTFMQETDRKSFIIEFLKNE